MEEKIEIINAKIEGTMLGFEDHGIFTSFIYLELEGRGHQGFGGYSLGEKYTTYWIEEILKTLNIDEWEKLKGVYVKVERSHSKIYKIGNILENKWFDPVITFEKIKNTK